MDHNNNSHDAGNSSEDFWQGAQEILQAGEQAAQLLNSQLFNVAYRMQMEDTINQWLTSEPKETMKRDSLYHQAKAQAQMATRMQGFIEQAQVVLVKQNAEQDPSVKRADFLDKQGFGIQ